ncbi:lysophospholipid acyltransferase family protein [Ovoidimarina sediminis]|uniref:lysophospholipid acyltransferase family protein n=1 Tax=Ovoidimarina sediminis TaxID=3079856 RepID=UPI002912387F|nr:lysophospholipid acyltransferase family protein [Rhodophyticola sp. MJ-SS7]MDU8944980.1 lysophospholipid acyltransferase family protein [Rhodophyticola sp. MJ-SS7]
MAASHRDWTARIQNALFRTALGVAAALPYRLRVPFMGWLVSTVVAPLAGWRRRVAENLALVRPGMTPAEIARFQRAVTDNAGRTLIENFSAEEMLARAGSTEITGPGLPALEAAREAGRPVITATAHFGNYEAARAALRHRGFEIGGLYRRLSNPRFNTYYEKRMAPFGQPFLPQGRRGTAAFIRALKEGRMMGILFDIYVQEAPEIPFLGQPTRTAVSAAEMALKYGAELIPIFGIRKEDGLSFRVQVEAPIPPSDPETMTRALNACLERLIDEHPEQWFWIHRRWK